MKGLKKVQILVFVLFSTLISINVNAQLPQHEYDALLSLYNTTGGDNWTIKTNWKVGDPCLNQWYGINCVYPYNRVTSIELPDNNLIGHLPDNFGTYERLQHLLIINNKDLTGLVPHFGGESQIALTDIILSNNNLTGLIPASIGAIPQLNHLDMRSNHIGGILPVEYGNLNNLRYLDLQDNQITGSIPFLFGSLSKLETLNLNDNIIGGTIPTSLGNAIKLKSLNLQNNELVGIIPSTIVNPPFLSSINLSNNNLTGPISPLLFNRGSRIINLSSNNLSGLVPDEVSNFGGVSLRAEYNSLRSNNSSTIDLLNGSCGCNWLATQTGTPVNFQVQSASNNSISLNWDAIPFQQDGGYKVLMASVDTGPYTEVYATGNKAVSAYTQGGLSAGQNYYFKVQSFTNPHDQNASLVISDASDFVSDTTDLTAGSANLGIEITTINSLPNNRIQYITTVSNTGNDTAVNTNFIHQFPQALYNGTWTCANATGGASCPVVRAVSGDLDELLTLSASSSLEFTFESTIDTTQDPTGFVTAFTITPPDGISDTDLNDNVQFLNFELLFESGFE